MAVCDVRKVRFERSTNSLFNSYVGALSDLDRGHKVIDEAEGMTEKQADVRFSLDIQHIISYLFSISHEFVEFYKQTSRHPPASLGVIYH